MDNTLNTITNHQVTAGCVLEILRLNMCFVRAFVCIVGNVHLFVLAKTRIIYMR